MTDPANPLFLCIGDIDVDILIGVDHLPTRDGKVNGEHRQRVPGGMAGNVSAALARLGASVRILGRVGDDDEAAFALDALAGSGVDTDFVVRLAGVRTFSCIGLITPDGEKSLIKLMTKSYRPSAEEMTAEVCAGVTHVHLTSVGDPSLCQRVVAVARACGATTSVDVERADCPSDPTELAAAIEGFDLLFCNSEARAVLDDRLGGKLTKLVPSVVTTLGERGARVEAGALSIAAAGFPAAVVDTTGAGDCFAAACLHARLLQRLDWPEALRFANRAAALSTLGYGAQAALPTLSDVQAALAR
ncbi:MAG TPA: carbohydrate kinase family protein [Roseiarcus sp.]